MNFFLALYSVPLIYVSVFVPVPKWFFLFLFLAAFLLHCRVRAFSSGGERGLLFIAVHGLHVAVASFVVEQGL